MSTTPTLINFNDSVLRVLSVLNVIYGEYSSYPVLLQDRYL